MSKTTGIRGKTMPQLIRAQAAEVRQRERATRTDAQQLAVLDQRPGQSLRERARLAVSA
jgi:hypothetical protein